MKREDYLREVEASGAEVRIRLTGLLEAANPLNQLRHEVSRDWKAWITGSGLAGLVAGLLARGARRRRRSRKDGSVGTATAASGDFGGARFWIPTVLKLLPAAMVQIVPLFMSMRSARKP